MNLLSSLEIISFFGVAITLFTSLLIGLSLVDIPFQKYVKHLVILCLIASGIHALLSLFINSSSLLLLLYLLFVPFMVLVIKNPISQIIISILLALTYNLSVIHLLADNLLGIALNVSDVSSDPLIQIMFSTFISLTNIFITIVIYRNAPVLFPTRWFSINIIEEKQTTLYQLHFLFIILILLAIDAFLFYTYIELPTLDIYFRLFLMAWSIVICALFLFFSKNIVLYNIERMEFSLDKTYQKDLHAFHNIIRSQRHDFNIHLSSIYGLIENKKFDESNRYIQEIVNETRDINDLLPLHHPAIGSLLYTYKELAIQKGITLDFHLQYDLKHMPCNIYEMNKILGNLLENAIDEVSYGTIHVDIDKQYGQIVISIANTIDVDNVQTEQIFSKGFTTKNGHEGIGLPAIQNIISKYNGVIYPTIQDNTIIMTVRIPLVQ